MIDLHTHSTHSDGFLTPTELIKQASKIGLEAIALTDHDAVSGLNELHLAAKRKKIEVVNGSELSVYYPDTDMEIIALDIPEDSLYAFALYQQEEVVRREQLARRRVELLQKAGYNITYEDVAFDAKGNPRTQIRRPHFTDVLLKKGYIKTVDEAYKNIFAKGGVCYVKNNPWFVSETIKFIRDNGAKAILAHPIHTKRTGQAMYDLITELKSYGLSGVEVFHSSHPQKERLEYLEIIKELKLITAGGSDFHGGTAHPENELGFGRHHNLNIPYMVLEQIKKNKAPTLAYYKALEKQIRTL